MKLNLEQHEIERAISQYVTSKVKLDPSQHLEIEFTSGRNPPTVSASVDIIDNDILEGSDATDGDTSDTDKKPFSDDQQEIPFGFLGEG